MRKKYSRIVFSPSIFISRPKPKDLTRMNATDNLCPCGSAKTYAECCEPIIKGTSAAQTPEQLMRSRYSAYVKAEVDHILKSTSSKQREGLDEKATRTWAEGAQWLGLEIIKCEKGGPDDDTGTVEFVASYKEGETIKRHHELGTFKRFRDKWYYEDGAMVKPKPLVREEPRVGRNDPCSCGSGKKYKKCCALKADAAA